MKKVSGAAKVIRSVKVQGERKRRRVYYVRRPHLYDGNGRTCKTPLELGIALSNAINNRDAEAVAAHCWDALNFVHNGKVPRTGLETGRSGDQLPLRFRKDL